MSPTDCLRHFSIFWGKGGVSERYFSIDFSSDSMRRALM